MGDRVLIASGSAIPADALLCPGKPIQVDQAALTGESLPKTMYPGEVVKMGSTCTRGESEALVWAHPHACHRLRHHAPRYPLTVPSLNDDGRCMRLGRRPSSGELPC